MQPQNHNTKFNIEPHQYLITESEINFTTRFSEMSDDEVYQQKSQQLSVAKTQLKKILSNTSSSHIKIQLVSGFMQNIRDMIFKHTNKCADKQFVQSREQEFLWREIECLEELIIQKRKEKQSNQNTMDIYYDEATDVQQLIEVKIQMLQNINSEIAMIKGYKNSLVSTIAESTKSCNFDNI